MLIISLSVEILPHGIGKGAPHVDERHCEILVGEILRDVTLVVFQRGVQGYNVVVVLVAMVLATIRHHATLS